LVSKHIRICTHSPPSVDETRQCGIDHSDVAFKRAVLEFAV
jgi:hypothetical protein